MLAEKIVQFARRFKKYAISYKKGVYYIPYLGNGPEATYESFKHTPLMKWNDEQKMLTQKSFLLDGFAYLYEIENGLWAFVSRIHYKKNVEIELYFDPGLKADYHIFTLNNLRHESKKGVALVNGFPFETTSWNFFKPLSHRSLINFKDTLHLSIGFYISEDWLRQYIQTVELREEHPFLSYLKSSREYSISPNIDAGVLKMHNKVLLTLQQPGNAEKKKVLKQLAYVFLQDVIQSAKGTSAEMSEALNPLMYSKLTHIEQLLNDSVLSGFPGIDQLAKAIRVSSSKLKNDFKLAYGVSLFQYYRSLQMKLAAKLLREDQRSIKDIASLIGYEHPGKFAAAFKKEIGVSPSEVQRNI